jgi:hypothetical protein
MAMVLQDTLPSRKSNDLILGVLLLQPTQEETTTPLPMQRGAVV